MTSKSKIKCIVTGEILGVRPDVYAKRIQKAGSEFELHRTYVSREAKQLLREGKTVDEIRKMYNSPGHLDPVPQDILNQIKSKKPTRKQKTPNYETEIQDSAEIDEDVKAFLDSGDFVDLTTLSV